MDDALSGRWIGGLLSALLLTACGGAPNADAPAAPMAQVRVARVAEREVSSTLEAYGTVDFAPEQQQVVAATGAVAIEAVAAAAGQPVRRGDVLLWVRPSADAASERQRAQADAAAAGRDLARTERLLREHLATNADLSSARQAAANAQAALRAAQRRTPALGRFPLRADHDAVVLSVDVRRGDIVAADTALVRLGDPAALSVVIGVEPGDLGRLATGQRVELQPLSAAAATPAVEGVVDGITPQIDPATRLASARVRVPPLAPPLIAGSAVRARVTLGRRAHAATVPRAAVVHDGDASYVFILDGAIARRHQVALGEAGDTWIEIVRGVEVGQPVVTEGANVLEDGMHAQVLRAVEGVR